MKNPTIKLPESLISSAEVVGGLNGGVRGSRTVNGGMRLSEANAGTLDAEIVSKTARAGQPLRRVVRQVLNQERREG